MTRFLTFTQYGEPIAVNPSAIEFVRECQTYDPENKGKAVIVMRSGHGMLFIPDEGTPESIIQRLQELAADL